MAASKPQDTGANNKFIFRFAPRFLRENHGANKTKRTPHNY
jgi:hypothetical protein